LVGEAVSGFPSVKSQRAEVVRPTAGVYFYAFSKVVVIFGQVSVPAPLRPWIDEGHSGDGGVVFGAVYLRNGFGCIFPIYRHDLRRF